VSSPKRTSARPNLSAGILAYRRVGHGLEVLLVHPGGPYWRNKNDGAWSIPKGEIGTGEIRQRGGKRVIAFCGEAYFDTASLSSNTFEIEWPPSITVVVF
jgi:predicted NUDIX family NTP pyrophosphohydrolase